MSYLTQLSIHHKKRQQLTNGEKHKHCWRECKVIRVLWGMLCKFLKKIRMTYDPTIPLFTRFPKEIEFLYQKIRDTSHVYCSISHEGENVGPLQYPSLGDREQVICLRYTSYSNLGKIQEHYVKRNKPDTESSFAGVQYGAREGEKKSREVCWDRSWGKG